MAAAKMVTKNLKKADLRNYLTRAGRGKNRLKNMRGREEETWTERQKRPRLMVIFIVD